MSLYTELDMIRVYNCGELYWWTKGHQVALKSTTCSLLKLPPIQLSLLYHRNDVTGPELPQSNLMKVSKIGRR